MVTCRYLPRVRLSHDRPRSLLLLPPRSNHSAAGRRNETKRQLQAVALSLTACAERPPSLRWPSLTESIPAQHDRARRQLADGVSGAVVDDLNWLCDFDFHDGRLS
jgi:hypothetical protein